MSSACSDAIISPECAREVLGEDELRRKRLECIGALCSGIVHDLNNVLTPILMGVQLLRRDPTDESKRAVLEVIECGARRGADTVRQLLMFARGDPASVTQAAVPVVVAETVAVLRQTLPRNISITERVMPDLPFVSFDATQLQHVLLNLCLNARDAMPRGGDLHIAADRPQGRGAAQAAHGRGTVVTISVSDTGTGMSPELLVRAFDPYFSTKPPGQGTGLGLSTVRRLVEANGGEVEIHSQPGTGTQVHLHLSACCGTLDLERVPLASPPRGNGELILLVEDEASIRELMAEILQRHGFQTIVAENGAGAAAAHREQGPLICLTVTDLDMPVVDGIQLVTNLRVPPARVLIVTGQYELDAGRFAVPAGMRVLAKPFSPVDLLQAVHEALERAQAEG